MSEKMTPETAVALLEIAKDLTLAATDKNGFYVPAAEQHAVKGYDITQAFADCAAQVEKSYLSLLSGLRRLINPRNPDS